MPFFDFIQKSERATWRISMMRLPKVSFQHSPNLTDPILSRTSYCICEEVHFQPNNRLLLCSTTIKHSTNLILVFFTFIAHRPWNLDCHISIALWYIAELLHKHWTAKIFSTCSYHSCTLRIILITLKFNFFIIHVYDFHRFLCSNLSCNNAHPIFLCERDLHSLANILLIFVLIAAIHKGCISSRKLTPEMFHLQRSFE